MKTWVSKSEAAKIIGVSLATLDNWVRTSIPGAIKNGKYSVSMLQSFVEKQEKLSARANKKKSKKIDFPKELLNYLNGPTDWIDAFIDYASKKDINVVGHELVDLYKRRVQSEKVATNLASIIPENVLYAYSVAYQILLTAGVKSETGAYYTPKFLVREMILRFIDKSKKFLEPCCGTGFFVIEYILLYKENFKCWPEGLVFANEIDPLAAEITRLNILTATKNELKNFTVLNKDGLSLNIERVDLIITNPPYGIKNNYSEMKTKEIFSHFIHGALSKYLNENGVLSFVLPASVLAVEKHKEIRKFFLDRYTLNSVYFYGKSFDGVFSDIVVLDIVKLPAKEGSVVSFIDGEIKKVRQNALISSGYKITLLDDSFLDLCDKYNKIPSITLKNCLFALGIVTGNNAEFLLEKEQPQTKKIISGKEVLPGCIDYKNAKFIKDTPSKFQQKPPMDLFKKKKIIYKFISKKIVTAVDDSGVLTLNSANFFVLNNVILPEEYVSAILNSTVLNNLYIKKNGAPLKVLKKSIQELPIFVFEKSIINKIVENYKTGAHQSNDKLITETVENLLKF